MKLSEFRSLIREEIRKVLNESNYSSDFLEEKVKLVFEKMGLPVNSSARGIEAVNMGNGEWKVEVKYTDSKKKYQASGDGPLKLLIQDFNETAKKEGIPSMDKPLQANPNEFIDNRSFFKSGGIGLYFKDEPES